MVINMKDMEWIKKLYFAHRGLHNEKFPENTLAAFKNAVNNEFDIEMDIKLTKDQRIVVVHDNNLKRLCGKDIFVEKSNYEDIKDLKILDTNETIPLLTYVLDSLPETTSLLIELKPNSNHKTFVGLFLKTMDNYPHRFAIHSFDPRIINQFKKQRVSVIRGQISQRFTERHPSYFLMTHLLFRFWNKPDFINYDVQAMPNKMLDRLYQKGFPIIAFTAKSKNDFDMVRTHYDNAVFENFIPIKKTDSI